MGIFSETFAYINYEHFLTSWDEYSGPFILDESTFSFAAGMDITWEPGSDDGGPWTKLLPGNYAPDESLSATTASATMQLNLDQIGNDSSMVLGFILGTYTGGVGDTFGSLISAYVNWNNSPEELSYTIGIAHSGGSTTIGPLEFDNPGYPTTIVISMNATTRIISVAYFDDESNPLAFQSLSSLPLPEGTNWDRVAFSAVCNNVGSSFDSSATFNSIVITHDGTSGGGATYYTPNLAGTYSGSRTTFTKRR